MNYIANNFNHEVKTHRDYTDVSFYEDNSKKLDEKVNNKKTLEEIFNLIYIF